MNLDFVKNTVFWGTADPYRFDGSVCGIMADLNEGQSNLYCLEEKWKDCIKGMFPI